MSFDIPDVGVDGQVVHSLAKWKRLALKRYGFHEGKGLYTDMNAIRRDEETDNLHSIYVDQWDWEKIISREDRNVHYLKSSVRAIVGAVCETSEALNVAFPSLRGRPEQEVFFLTTQELEDMYPDLSPNERENEICRQHHTVFLMQIGKTLRSGIRHDGRAPDYDDWELNGDILLWNPVLERRFEISSMGIRVDEEALGPPADPLRLRRPPGPALPQDAPQRSAAADHGRRHRPVPAVYAAAGHLPYRRGPGQSLGPDNDQCLREGRHHAAVMTSVLREIPAGRIFFTAAVHAPCA